MWLKRMRHDRLDFPFDVSLVASSLATWHDQSSTIPRSIVDYAKRASLCIHVLPFPPPVLVYMLLREAAAMQGAFANSSDSDSTHVALLNADNIPTEAMHLLGML